MTTNNSGGLLAATLLINQNTERLNRINAENSANRDIEQLPIGEFTEAEAARKAEKDPELDNGKGMSVVAKVIGLGALVAAAIFIVKKMKGKLPGSDGGMIAP